MPSKNVGDKNILSFHCRYFCLGLNILGECTLDPCVISVFLCCNHQNGLSSHYLVSFLLFSSSWIGPGEVIRAGLTRNSRTRRLLTAFNGFHLPMAFLYDVTYRSTSKNQPKICFSFYATEKLEKGTKLGTRTHTQTHMNHPKCPFSTLVLLNMNDA